jgi:hypothetical protein
VSSDSDFTRLATRIREAGLSVYGFGEEKTPRPFVAACDRFVYTEILRPAQKGAPAPSLPSPAEPLAPALDQAIAGATREDGWAPLSTVGSLLTKANPSFDPRNYGFQKLGELVRAQNHLEVKAVPVSDGSQNVHLFVRCRER